MPSKLIRMSAVILFLTGLLFLTQTTSAQVSYPTPAPLNRPDYNYSEANSCTRCHFVYGERGDHMLEAVGVKYSEDTQAFSFTGSGWFASHHSQTNYRCTQNTYCAKCHSPLQATPQASFKDGFLENSELIPDGKMEGVTCASCHPTHTSAVVLGRRLGIYQWGMDRNKPEAYKVIHEGEEDLLCLNCHIERHNETNAAFRRMYEAGVRCIDCHMAPYGNIKDTEVEKRFHDFKVAQNLPFSCGVEGSIVQCHPGFSTNATLAFLPYLKEQHKEWWPKKGSEDTGGTMSFRPSRKLKTAEDYIALWREIQTRIGE